LFSKSFSHLTFAASGLLAALLLTACGGGSDTRGCGSDCDATTSPSYPIVDPDMNSLPPSSSYANICTGQPWYPEKSFVLTYMNENYLWYSEMVPPSVDQYNEVGYFEALLSYRPGTSAHPVPHPVDSYSYVTSTYMADIMDTGYSPGGYGFSWVTDRNGLQRVAYVAPGSPAAQAGMRRGGVLRGFDSYGAGTYPYGANSTTLSYQDPGSAVRSIPLATVPFQQDPVPIVSIVTPSPFPVNNRKIGYLLVLDYSSIAQDKLIDAITSLRVQGMNELVLDLRYNQGGFIHAAQSLASMIAGSNAVGGFGMVRTFERQVYNGKVPNVTLPFTTTVTWQPGITSLPPGYNNSSNRVKYSIGYPLPALNLSRVYILTTDLTASASESLINALRGVDVDVVQIGTLTAGIPYGSNRRDNCGEAYYPIEYQGFNNKGFGDYTGGLAPTCLVHDDFNYPLGDGREALLNAATEYIRTGQCPATATQ
jgi:hypothetical protein